MSELQLNYDQFLELQKLGLGTFAPLQGFMRRDQLDSVVETMRLPDGSVFSVPVYLDVSAEDAARLRGLPKVTLLYNGVAMGEVVPEDISPWDRAAVARQVFGVDTTEHPGVANVLAAQPFILGGPVRLLEAGAALQFDDEMTPAQRLRAEFARRGWKTVVGFQTRNVPHRAHEYLQRVGLELCDGLFIQPIVGKKKAGDYTPEAVLAGYKALIGGFLPADRVALGVLSTAMRYAGPREALFHALIRRNHGCTHFIVGRDHAGVKDFYGKYEAHAMVDRFAAEMGISILKLHGPFHCSKCDSIVTEKTCAHALDPQVTTEISGTLMRALLRSSSAPRPELMRPEVIAALSGLEMFIGES